MARPWRSAARTDPGKRRVRNEDAFLDCPEQGLWAVADGMGGHQSGDIASQLIVASLGQMPPTVDFDERVRAVRECLHWLNRRLGQELTVASGQPDRIVGSTVVALLVEDQRAVCVWAGDSRCYLWRDQRLYQLTRDHSLQQRLIDEQQMSPEQAQAHPAAQALTRAVGAQETLRLDVLELAVCTGDVFLLCSDGLYQELTGNDLGNALDLGAPHDALEHLFECVLRGDARDNLTAVIVRQ